MSQRRGPDTPTDEIQSASSRAGFLSEAVATQHGNFFLFFLCLVRPGWHQATLFTRLGPDESHMIAARHSYGAAMSFDEWCDVILREAFMLFAPACGSIPQQHVNKLYPGIVDQVFGNGSGFCFTLSAVFCIAASASLCSRVCSPR